MDKKIGIIGYGSMGKMISSKFMESKIIPESNMYISNRTFEKIIGLKTICPLLNICKNNIDVAYPSKLAFLPLDKKLK